MRSPLLLFLSSALLACSASATDGDASGGGEDDYTKKGRLQLLVTVDWEGRDLRDDNLAAMQDLHAKFPQIKVINFLNAAYYTKSGAQKDDVTARIQRGLGPSDEKGLHIHGWKSLFEAAGVTFKNTPTFWGTTLQPQDCLFDCGHEVPISEYTTDDLRKVVKLSLDTLESNGFGRAKSFRTGGWMAKQNVRDAVAAEGLVSEQSAVPVEFLKPQLGAYPVYGWLGDLWKDTTRTSQPYVVDTASAPLLEIPDNGCLSDYVSAQQMVDVFEANKAAFLADRSKNVVVSIGFHEETASMYVPVLEEALGRIFEEVQTEKLPLDSVTSDAIASASATK
ncbi:MAG TPA: hypothetical protein VIF62_11520 [Labilithrix sp.]